jgi:hypothetical protein
MMITPLFFALALFGQTAQDPDSQPSPEAPVTEVEEVTVRAQRVREAVNSFLDEVTDPPRGRGPARWSDSVCVGAVNLRRTSGQYVVDRVSEVALDLGLDIGEPGCSPNILVLATEDGPGLARALVSERPYAFRPGYAGASQSRASLQRFQSNERPVRWWHVSLPVDSDTGAPAVSLPGYGPAMVSVQGSLLRTEIRNDLTRAFIIVDFVRAEGVSLEQLADYVAMVAFAQVDPEARTGAFDTILNLFDDEAPPPRMTDWDRAYLRSLYSAELNQRSSAAQRGAIASSMSRDRERTEPLDESDDE